MKRIAKSIVLLIALVVAILLTGYVWLRNQQVVTTRTLYADCAKLQQTGIEIPVTTTVSGSGEITCIADLVWLNTNFAPLLRASMPGEGGDGGKRHFYSGFRIAARDDGVAEGFLHVKTRSYVWTSFPPVSIHTGTAEVDVWIRLTPSFGEDGMPTVQNSIEWDKTRSGGLGHVIGEILPSIWFSIERLVNKEMNKSRSSASSALLVLREDAATQKQISHLVSQRLLQPKTAAFFNGPKGVQLKMVYQLNRRLAPVAVAKLKWLDSPL